MPSLIMFDSGGNDAFTKSLLHFDGAHLSTTFTDDAVGATGTHTWTRNNIFSAIVTTTSVFGGACYGITGGQGAFLSTPDHADFTLGSSDYCIDLWINREGATGQEAVCGQISSDLLTFAWGMVVNADGTVSFNGGATSNLQSSASVNDSSWHHVAAMREGSASYLYVDFALEATGTASGSATDASTALTIARYGDYTGITTFSGSIDEFRMSVGTSRLPLIQQQVAYF
jgi:Concanavalin A-like lectin/glucanases superfamily